MNENLIERLKNLIDNAEAIVIGAGAGLSTSAGYAYSGKRFKDNFSDFEEKYGFHDMYYGGFFSFDTPEEFWAYWSRYIYINRYLPIPTDTYEKLFNLVKDKNYFVITTNVDHCFQRSGFDKQRLFYTQGDFGLFQCSATCHNSTYDNEEVIRKMVAEQKNMRVPSELVPHCPKCGKPMSMNLRADNTFSEDIGWQNAAFRYESFIKTNINKRILFLELGVGFNTPVIIKYPFMRMTMQNDNAFYVCINKNDIYIPDEIQQRSIGIEEDIKTVIEQLNKKMPQNKLVV